MGEIRLIDANTQISKLDSMMKSGEYDCDSIAYVKSFFDKAPTVDAAPVRHGYWIECDYKTLEHGEIESAYKAGLCCSVCRTGFKKSKMTFKQYCAACGAKMDGGAEDAT